MNDDRDRKRRALAYAVAVGVVAAVLILAYLNRQRPGSVVYRKDLMGTVVEFTLMEGERKNFDRAAEAGFSEIERLTGLLSSYDPDSDVSRITPGGGPVAVAPEVVEVVARAVEIAGLTGGAFDPTVGTLAGLWGYSGESGKVPAESDVKKVLGRVDYRMVSVDRENSAVTLAGEGTALNLGGVAKGYIVGKTIEKLRANGVTRGIVKAGGDMTVFQEPGGKRRFTIGIRHPRKADELLGEAHVSSGAVTTSGDYERYFVADGVRYHHILDPSTGFPARGTRSVTIIAEDPTYADALSTGVFVMGPERGMELVERLNGVEAVIVDDEGKVSRSKGFRGMIYQD